MTEDLNYDALEPIAGLDPAVSGRAADLSRLRDVPVELSVEIGRARMSVGDTLGLRPGSIVTLDRLAEEAVDLLVNGTRIARGEVVVIDEAFGLRITEIPERNAQQLARAATSKPIDGDTATLIDADVVEDVMPSAGADADVSADVGAAPDEPAANAA